MLRAQVSEQAARFRALMIVLGIIVVGAAAVLVWQGRTAQQQVATLGTALDSLSRQLAALRVAQGRADSEATALRAQIAAARSTRQRDSLQLSLAAVQQRQRGITAAQGVDWGAINRANSRAIAMIYVRFADTTRMFTGTGFSVAPEGLLLTNRHVVISDQGERPRDIAVQFSGSAAVLRGRLEQVAPDVDIATIRITDAGTYPVVQGLRSDSAGVEVGDPIALIGYPLGLDTPMGTRTVNTTLAPGTIGKILPDSLLQLDAYSGTGASGSPILDRNGQVIGMEFGGLRESGGRIVLGLPIRRAMALLGSAPSAPHSHQVRNLNVSWSPFCPCPRKLGGNQSHAPGPSSRVVAGEGPGDAFQSIRPATLCEPCRRRRSRSADCRAPSVPCRRRCPAGDRSWWPGRPGRSRPSRARRPWRSTSRRSSRA